MQAHGIVNLKVAGPTPFGEHKQAMVTRKEWAPLISLIDKGLNAITAEQHIAIRQRWLASVADGGMQAPLDLSDEERAWLAANPTIRVGAYALPPYIQEQNGRVDGYLVELMRAIAARAGLRAEFHFLTLEQVKEGTERGTLDVSLAVNPTPERARVLFFSQGTVDFTLSIFARKEARDIEGLESLAGKTLATYPGYSWNAQVSRGPAGHAHRHRGGRRGDVPPGRDRRGGCRHQRDGVRQGPAAPRSPHRCRAQGVCGLRRPTQPSRALFRGEQAPAPAGLDPGQVLRADAGGGEAAHLEPLVHPGDRRRQGRSQRRGTGLPGSRPDPPGPCRGVDALRLCRRRRRADGCRRGLLGADPRQARSARDRRRTPALQRHPGDHGAG